MKKLHNMENKLLQSFLQAGLLNIGDNDERLEHIEKSILDLQEKLKADYTLLPKYTLVALDPNISNNEPVLEDIEEIVTSYWKSLRGKFQERPISILRVVLLNALYKSGISSEVIARIIYLTASNFYPYAKLAREKELVEQIIADLGELAEKDADEEWSLADEDAKLVLPALKITANQSEESLKPEQLYASITTPLDKFFGEFKKSFDQLLENSFKSIRSSERRSELLWWKESLYSFSLKDSYRTVHHNIQPVIMAVDLYHLLPAITPVSVDFVLRETVLLVNSDADEKISFSELLQRFTEYKDLLKKYFKEINTHSGRISITDFISLIIYDKVAVSTFQQYTGIEEGELVSLNDVAVMILHDFMVQHLLTK